MCKPVSNTSLSKVARRSAIVMITLVSCSATMASSLDRTRHQQAPAHLLGAPAVRSIEQMQDVTRHMARQEIAGAAQRAFRDGYRTSSTDRLGTSAIHSRNHDRGAMDFVTPHTGTPRMQSEARQFSRQLGSNYTVVVEQPYRARVGPSYQRDTAYSNGQLGNTRSGPARATGTHVHAQPNYGIDVPWRAGTFGRDQR
jgi:hypothetical protein